MKGVIFTEFFSLVEETYGYEMVDDLIQNTNLPSNGIYTAVGTYDHTEMVSLLDNLNLKTGIAIDKLLIKFGHSLYRTFSTQYSHLLDGVTSAFDMLSSIEDHIHVEVKKLYPDAQLPYFEIHQNDENHLTMIYFSERKLGYLAYGLIQACIQSFGTFANIDMVIQDDEGKHVRFDIRK